MYPGARRCSLLGLQWPFDSPRLHQKSIVGPGLKKKRCGVKKVRDFEPVRMIVEVSARIRVKTRVTGICIYI